MIKKEPAYALRKSRAKTQFEAGEGRAGTMKNRFKPNTPFPQVVIQFTFFRRFCQPSALPLFTKKGKKFPGLFLPAPYATILPQKEGIQMPTIADYIEEHGGESFFETPFNEVDNYLICKLVNPDYTGILGPESEEVPIGEAMAAYEAVMEGSGRTMGRLASPVMLPILLKLPETGRYRALRLSRYVRRWLPDRTEQFSAITVTLPTGRRYVAFRGTDDTLLAWKENFLMSSRAAVAAQEDAAAYLAGLGAGETPLIVGGHSKGGNLAVYAAAMCPEAMQERITDVYNNDGPGFQPEFFEQPGYRRIRSRIHTLLPQYTIVGTLLTREKWASVVKAAQPGFAAHDGFTWEVRGTSFARCPVLSRSSQAFEETMDNVLGTMDMAQREDFVNELFDALTATGAVTVTDLTEHRLRQALTIVSSFRHGTGTKKFVFQVMEELLRAYASKRLGWD